MIREILEQIGWPTDILLLDFEAYFDFEYHMGQDKKAISIVEYVTDSRFRFTGLGLQLNDTFPIFIGGPNVKWVINRLKDKFGKAFHNCTVITQNNKFDILILAEKFGIYPPYTIDILDLSRYYDARMSHKLKDLCKLFKLPDKGNTNQFKGLYWETMSLEQQQALKEYCLGDVKNEKSLLEILLPMLDNPLPELTLTQHTLNLYLKPILTLDLEQAEQISRDMSQALQQDLDKVSWILEYKTKDKATISEILRSKKFANILQQHLSPYGEIVPMKQGKNKMIPATAQDDVAFQLLLVHKDEKVRNLCQAKAACTSWPLHQSKVNHLIKQVNCSNGLIRVPLKYYGAHTGRWSGTEYVNLLNLGGKGRTRPIHPLISQVRNTLMAPDGYILLIVDSAQIEARETAWVAHQNDLVKGFANGEDIYSEFATELFQEKVWRPTEEEKKTPEGKTADIRRGFGKDTILGCDFGLGSNTFFDRCRQDKTLRPLFDSGTYDWDFVDRLIKTYRTKYADIPAFWSQIEKCFRWPTKYPKERTEYIISEHARIMFFRSGSTTKMRLPSGRIMNYRFASMDKNDKIRYLWGHLWGGSITENLIQAMCRDLLGYWLLKCEETGIQIVLHSYDELVACVPEEVAQFDLDLMIDIMSHGPDWAEGLPLAAEGCISKRYKK